MLKGRNLGEGLARQLRLLAMGAERYVDELVRHPFFRQREPRAPHIGAEGKTIHNRVCHCFCQWLRRRGALKAPTERAALEQSDVCGSASDCSRAARSVGAFSA